MTLARSIQLLAILGTTQVGLAQSLNQPDVPTALYERQGDKIVKASADDFAAAKTYHLFRDKGPVIGGERITILTTKLKYKMGEPIRVVHVLESIQPGIKVYVMGPKAVTDEYVDGLLAGTNGPTPDSYRGAVISRPIADFNYDITSYTFTTPGNHTIQWKGHGGFGENMQSLESNTINVEVLE